MDLVVRHGAEGWRLLADGQACDCRIGRGGLVAAADKREGDGATPIGRWPLRRLLYRPDRLAAPATRLPVAAITPDDGWCDDPGDPAYNRPVTLPYRGRRERLWRADGLYDLVIVLGHNDDPPVPGCGSAIFLHCLADPPRPTEGCVALARADLLSLLPALGPDDALRVEGP